MIHGPLLQIDFSFTFLVFVDHFGLRLKPSNKQNILRTVIDLIDNKGNELKSSLHVVHDTLFASTKGNTLKDFT